MLNPKRANLLREQGDTTARKVLLQGPAAPGSDPYLTDSEVDSLLAAQHAADEGEFAAIADAYPGTEAVQDLVGAMVTGNTETGITVTYEDADGTLDFVVDDTTKIAKSVITEKGDILYGSAASTAAVLAHGDAGDLLKSGGHNAAPAWQKQGTGNALDADTLDTKHAGDFATHAEAVLVDGSHSLSAAWSPAHRINDLQPYCCVGINAATAYGTGAWNYIALDTEYSDSLGMHSNVVNNTRVTPGIAGLYWVHVDMRVLSLSAGKYLWGYIKVNHADPSPFMEMCVNPMAATEDSLLMGDFVVELDSDDYVEVVTYHNKGSNLTFYGGGDGVFAVTRIAGGKATA